MTKLKKIILFIIILIIIIISIILCIIHFNKGEVLYNIDEEGTSDEEANYIDTKIQLVDSRNEYYAVKQCVEKFYMYYGYIYDEDTVNESVSDVDGYDDGDSNTYSKEECVNNVYEMLDKDYIDYKNITLENLTQKIENIKTSDVDINEMYVSQKNVNVSIYIVKGRLKENTTDEMSDFKLMLKLDAVNKTFTVFLGDYIDEKFSDIKIGDEININVDDSIEKNEINIYDYKNITDENYVRGLLLKYQNEVLFDQETAYNNLDEEYREKRFGSLDNFKEYAKNNIIRNVKLKLAKYQINNYDDYTEYVCLDNDGNYYIFNEKSIMNYGLLLDTYTVNVPQFIKKYENGDNQLKVGMNIDKVLSAIKENDYNYIYSKLDDTYKNNNFNTVEEFKAYIQSIFVSDNVSYSEFKDLGGVYTYKLLIDNNESNITVIMKLLDNDDFVMSFEIK